MDWIVLLTAVSGSLLAALWLGQSRTWDQLNYHYYNGYALLRKPWHYDFAPAQVQTFFNPTFQVPVYLMLKHLSSKAVAMILAAIQGLNIWLIYRIAKELFSRHVSVFCELLSLACAVTAFYGAANISELGSTFGDNLISVLPLTAIWLIICYLLRTEGFSKFRLLLAGLISGLALGLKLTVFIYVLPLLMALFLVTLISGRKIMPVLLVGAGILIGFSVSYTFWGLSLYRQYQNPFFPYFNNIFRSPYYDLENTMDSRFLPQTWAQTLFYPFFFSRSRNLVSEPFFRDVRFAACYILIVLLGIWKGRHLMVKTRAKTEVVPGEKKENDCLLFLLLFFLSAYILWQQFFGIYRYAVLLEFLAPVFITAGILFLGRRQWMAVPVSLCLNLILCAGVIPLDFGRYKFQEDYLRVQPPAWEHLEESVVLMAGKEATAYIIPSFPASTRFVRVFSNFLNPGRNVFLDEKIRAVLAQYSSARTLVYLSGLEELQTAVPVFLYFAVTVNEATCAEVVSTSGHAGYLCRTGGIVEPENSDPLGGKADQTEAIVFIDRPEVRLEVTPASIQVNQDMVVFQVSNLKAKAIDLFYTIDGQEMPPIRHWRLNSRKKARIFADPKTAKGRYRIIGIRDSDAPFKNQWIRVDVQVTVQ